MSDPQSEQIFISYSHKDSSWLRRLQIHLQPLVRHHAISVWDDTKIAPSTDWRAEINRALSSAKVAVLLVSPDFLASTFIATHELPTLLDAASKRGLRIFWIAIHSSLFEETPIARYQAANDPARPLSKLKRSDQDRVLVEICGLIKAAILHKSSHGNGSARAKNLPPCPYRGLFAFGETDAEVFFGREALTEYLFQGIQQKDFITVLGSSGSGKSSLVFAGLLPQVRREKDWLVATFRPFDSPFYSLAAALMPILEPEIGKVRQLEEVDSLANALRSKRISLELVMRQIVLRSSVHCVLLVVDQFEEIYSLCQDRAEQFSFLDALLSLRLALRGVKRIKIVLTLRADFLGQALSYSPFVDALQNADVKLGPLTKEELQHAIEKPAFVRGVGIERGLTQRIMQAVSRAPANLPLLEFALSLLWEHQENDMLTHSAYDKIGGVERALANHADTVYNKLEGVDKILAEKVFVQLVNPGEGTEDTRRRATRSELGETRWKLLSRLADEDARLIVSSRSEVTGEDTGELVHEALISGWARLQDWMRVNREFRTWQENLRFLMRHWEENKRSESAVLTGMLLDDAESWMSLRAQEMSQAEIDFITASQASRDKDARLQEGDRLAALGMLAAGVAHEVNTPITGISSYVQMLLADTPEDHPHYEILRKLEKQSFRAARVINNLLEFSRGRTVRNEPIDLGSLLEQTIELFAARCEKENIKVNWRRPEAEIMIVGDEAGIQQVFSNLLTNSIDAMRDTGGLLDVSIGIITNRVLVQVQDTGPGIPVDHLEKIFQPFFSTKINQGGTGLGLAISLAIVREHGGTIQVKKLPAKGACVAVEFPLPSSKSESSPE